MNQSSKNKDALSEILVNVNRVAKVTKGGRRFSFSACVVVGNGKGMVGYGNGKAKEILEARGKAVQAAKKNMISVPIYQNRTIHHDVKGKNGASIVIIRKAKPGKGIIAGGSMRSVFSLLGLKDVVSKSICSSGFYNILSATFDGLKKLSSPSSVAKRRGVDVIQIVGNKKNIGQNNE